MGKMLFQGAMPKVKSALLKDGSLTSSMKRAILEVVASGVALLASDVKLYAKCTFLFHSLDSGVYESNGKCNCNLIFNVEVHANVKNVFKFLICP